MTSTLRERALQMLLVKDASLKAAGSRVLDPQGEVGAQALLAEPGGIPGRPVLPTLVAHTELRQRSIHTVAGRAALIHALAHIELNAIDLALDVCWRFAGMPDLFYRQWIGVAREEALHFELLRDHLLTMGFRYGDFPAHGALWEMAEKTRHDLLARLALVPRTLEARGLDASPPMKARLIEAGDLRAGDILDVILRDEIRHVAIGNHWYNMLCDQRGLDPVATYSHLASTYGAPRLRGPFNDEARRAAGFTELELLHLRENQPRPRAGPLIRG